MRVTTKQNIGLILSWILTICIIFTSTRITVLASNIPGLDCAITERNLIKLVKKYDSDAAYILNRQKKKGDNIQYWLSRANRLIDGVEIAVHEEVHAFVTSNTNIDYFYDINKLTKKEYRGYYIGDKKKKVIPLTKVFKSYKATKTIKKKYRTERFDTYVGKSSIYDSNINGIYGLFDEFCAYYWGMHVVESLYPYLEEKAESLKDWQVFKNTGKKDSDAYADFYYYILTYLKYAKANKPSIYKGIMSNKNFIVAFDSMQKKYEKLIEKYNDGINTVSKKYYGDGFSSSPGTDSYKKITKQIEKEFKEIRKTIKRKVQKYNKN